MTVTLASSDVVASVAKYHGSHLTMGIAHLLEIIMTIHM